jgi:hypothetical protein
LISFFLLQAVVMVIESMHEKTEEAMSKLLQSLFRSFIITIDQMRNVSQQKTFYLAYLKFEVKAGKTIGLTPSIKKTDNEQKKLSA